MAATRKYMWEEWFGRPLTLVVQGVDYQCSQSTMVAQIRNCASRRGVRVRLTDVGDSIVIEVVSEIPHANKVAIAVESETTLAQVRDAEEATESCNVDVSGRSRVTRAATARHNNTDRTTST